MGECVCGGGGGGHSLWIFVFFNTQTNPLKAPCDDSSGQREQVGGAEPSSLRLMLFSTVSVLRLVCH